MSKGAANGNDGCQTKRTSQLGESPLGTSCHLCTSLRARGSTAQLVHHASVVSSRQ